MSLNDGNAMYHSRFHPHFPDKAPMNRPRFIELVTRDNLHGLILVKPKLCDHIATFLAYYEATGSKPLIIKSFFNPYYEEVRIIAHLPRPDIALGTSNFVIWRKGREVYCGEFERFKNEFIWHCFLKSGMEQVSLDSSWHTYWSAHDIVSPAHLSGMWDLEFFKYRQGTKGSVDHFGGDEIKKQSQNFAHALSESEAWNPVNFGEYIVTTIQGHDSRTNLEKTTGWIDREVGSVSIKQFM